MNLARPIQYAGISAVVLIPCFWLERIQAGDLSSHIYNAWLAQLIEKGQADGLAIAPQATNVLFDLMLSGLLRQFGPDIAQRVAVSVAVLVFFWGAFAFSRAVARRLPWRILPCIAMLAYGWVFRMGFFNFYISMGLCLWAMALMWDMQPRRLAPAAVLLAVAYVAHGLPVLWSSGLLIYVGVARRLSGRGRAVATAACLLAMAVVHAGIRMFLSARWSPRQIALVAGVDQVCVFDEKYLVTAALFLFVWVLFFRARIRETGIRKFAASAPFQVCVIASAAALILPSAVHLPQFAHSLTYIPGRMSLGAAVCICGLLAAAEPRRWERLVAPAAAAIFFVLIYRDERALNALEARMQAAIANLPPGQRVISSVQDNRLRANSVIHMIDRVCIGRCYSFANYEPSTKQFRIRIVGPTRIVAAGYKQSFDLQFGAYVFEERDLPLYVVRVDEAGAVAAKPAAAGEAAGIVFWNSLENLPYS